MRSQMRIVLATLVLAVGWTLGGRVSRAIAAMETFRVRHVEVVGVTLLDPNTVLELLDLEEGSTVWGDTGEWAERVQVHPLADSVRIHRRIPGKLVVDVRETRPVALAPTPTLEAVDAHGRRLPVDPSQHALDLPVLGTSTPVPDARFLRARGRLLAGEVAWIMEADTAFLQRVSEVRWMDPSSLRVRWSEPSVEFLLPQATPSWRLQEGLAVLADVLAREPDPSPRLIDLRFVDQVVVRLNPRRR
ncbi:MAG: FtsQ-type POTRA domain-containing protein [Gemmatimonadota bacterium]